MEAEQSLVGRIGCASWRLHYRLRKHADSAPSKRADARRSRAPKLGARRPFPGRSELASAAQRMLWLLLRHAHGRAGSRHGHGGWCYQRVARMLRQLRKPKLVPLRLPGESRLWPARLSERPHRLNCA